MLMIIYRNAAWALAGLSIVSVVAILFSRISLEQFTPYLPFSIVTGLLLTIHMVPKVVGFFEPGDTIFPEEIRFAHSQWRGSDRASIGSGISEENIQGALGHFPPWDLVFSHMDHSDGEHHVRMISSSAGSVSSIDPELETGREDASSTASEDPRAQLL